MMTRNGDKGGFVSALADTEEQLAGRIATSKPWRPMDQLNAIDKLWTGLNTLDPEKMPSDDIKVLCQLGHTAQTLLANKPGDIKTLLGDMLTAPSPESYIATHITPWAEKPGLKHLATTLTSLVQLVQRPECKEAAALYIQQQLEHLPKAQASAGQTMSR
jgi:hypothetical protein